MARTIQCPNCKQPLQIREEQYDQKLTCPNCHSTFRVRAPGAKKPAPVAAPAPRTAPARRPQAAAPLPLGEEEGTMLGQMLPPPPPMPARNGPPPISSRRTAPVPPPRSQRQSVPPPLPAKSGGKLFTIIVVLLLLGGAGVGGWFGYQHFFGKKKDADKPKEEEVKSLGKFAGIEIGSSGVKMVAMEIYQTKDGIKYKILESLSKDTKIATFEKGSKDIDPVRLQHTGEAVDDYYQLAQKTHGAAPENIFVACSSGVMSKLKNETDENRNLNKLKDEIRKRIGKDLAIVDPRTEARYGVIAVVPREEWENVVLLDIGGNTKGGGFDNKSFTSISLDIGARSFEEQINRPKIDRTSFAMMAANLAPFRINEPLKRELDRATVLLQRKKVVLIGGIVWVMATYTHPKEVTQDRVQLNHSDFDAFKRMVANKEPEQIKDEVIAAAKSTGKDDVIKKATEDVGRIQGAQGGAGAIFPRNQVIAGAQILESVSQEMKLAGKEIEFVSKSQSWLLGYVLDKSGHWK